MKTTLYSLIAAAAALGMASAQTAYTTPVGYTSQTLAASTSNVVGINLQTPTLAAGLVTNVIGAEVYAAVDWSVVLPAGKTCVFEVIDGLAAGTVQDFITWDAAKITLPVAIPGLAANDKFSVRVSNTLQQLFPSGTLVSANFSATAADKVWVPQGDGSYIRYFVKGGTNPGWYTTPNGSTIGTIVTTDIPILYTDGLIVQTGATPISPLVFTGEVKTTGSNTLTKTGQNNLISIVPPVGLTLFTSGLEAQLNPANFSATAADKLWVPQGDGTYIRYFVRGGTTNPGWNTTPNGSTIGTYVGGGPDIPLPAGVFIQRVAATDKVMKLNVPTSYSSL